MPWLHRLACFRDDVVFLILLYQVSLQRLVAERSLTEFFFLSAGSIASTIAARTNMVRWPMGPRKRKRPRVSKVSTKRNKKYLAGCTVDRNSIVRSFALGPVFFSARHLQSGGFGASFLPKLAAQSREEICHLTAPVETATASRQRYKSTSTAANKNPVQSLSSLIHFSFIPSFLKTANSYPPEHR